MADKLSVGNVILGLIKADMELRDFTSELIKRIDRGDPLRPIDDNDMMEVKAALKQTIKTVFREMTPMETIHELFEMTKKEKVI